MSNPTVKRQQPPITAIDMAVASGRLTPAAAGNLSRWLEEPQYAEYHERLFDLIAREEFDELTRLFWERIPFGTGGRRGVMSEFGSATINDRTIAESAHGLAVYVKRWRDQNCAPDSGVEPQAVVAFDSRHRSLEFARRTACVLAAHGFRVHFFSEPRATPELSFAVRVLRCDTGVVISASHNPPSDNGFKAYWSTGGQILPPHDAGIIECVDAATAIPSIEFEVAVTEGRIILLDERLDSAYVNAVCALSLSRERTLTALYTPLHGVGESSVYRAVRQAGFDGVSIFESQRTLDGSFPNIPDHLPNPERFAVFSPAIAEAKRTGAELVLASDPDADRMAVAVRNRSGEFVCLTGNQLGALLTDYVLRKQTANGSLSPDHFIVETLVTTPLVADIGHSYGVKVVRDVLVGFKHIAAAIDAHGPDGFVFAVEESLGFLAGDYIRDKDAAVGALFVLELAAELKQRGQTLLDRLDELYEQHGVYAEQTVSIQCPGSAGHARIARIMTAFRTDPPAELGACVFDTVRDYEQHQVRSLPSNSVVKPLPEPVGSLLIFSGHANDGEVTIAIRPSGTEPKIKFYCFVRTSVERTQSDPVRRANDRLAAVITQLESCVSGMT